MATSLFLAKVMGVTFLVMGVAMLYNRKLMQEVVAGFVQHKIWFFFSGSLSLILGLLLVLTHNHWVSDWTVVVTIIAWLTLLKGLVHILLPGMATKMVTFFQKSNVYTVGGVASFLLGLYLVYMGFFA